MRQIEEAKRKRDFYRDGAIVGIALIPSSTVLVSHSRSSILNEHPEIETHEDLDRHIYETLQGEGVGLLNDERLHTLAEDALFLAAPFIAYCMFNFLRFHSYTKGR